jgi:adenine-specific DNA-methyltransferase
MSIVYSRSTAASKKGRVEDAAATAELIFSLGQREAQIIAAGTRVKNRTAFAKSFCTAVVEQLWKRRAAAKKCTWPCRSKVTTEDGEFPNLVERLAHSAATMSNPRAGFLLGQLYTALLPEVTRKTLGAYYTPPPLVERLLNVIDEAGFDWSAGRVIDPACGGAAFLAFLAPKLAGRSRSLLPMQKLADVERRLLGIELDEFAAWMSMVLLDICLLDLAIAAGRRLKPLVRIENALDVKRTEIGGFDLIIGNPPYGRTSLKTQQRKQFQRSLFGHANLYGVFTELAVQLANETALIAYVTPASFLGGQYFKNLRRLLSEKAPLRQLDFVRDRNGVFDGVLQETTLAIFDRSRVENVTVKLSSIKTGEAGEPVTVHRIGRVRLQSDDGGVWLLPRTANQCGLIERVTTMEHRLASYGFAVSTGQFVWNRHKKQLRSHFGDDCYPVIWAEAVSTDGTFRFQAEKRTHLPYVRVAARQAFLLNQEPCILVQRTTAKEQKRRLICAVIPNSFVLEYPGFVVENHLNMIYSTDAKSRIALKTVATLLNSTMVDQVFRCVSGSVAVSAYEINSLPLPAPDQVCELQEAILAGQNSSDLDKMITQFYAAPIQHLPAATADSERRRDRRVAA